jgi:hypothetical protein
MLLLPKYKENGILLVDFRKMKIKLQTHPKTKLGKIPKRKVKKIRIKAMIL